MDRRRGATSVDRVGGCRRGVPGAAGSAMIPAVILAVVVLALLVVA